MRKFIFLEGIQLIEEGFVSIAMQFFVKSNKKNNKFKRCIVLHNNYLMKVMIVYVEKECNKFLIRCLTRSLNLILL